MNNKLLYRKLALYKGNIIAKLLEQISVYTHLNNKPNVEN